MAIIKQLHVNGSPRTTAADSERSLLQVLREDLGLTGAKYGCGEGQCGACSVLINGKATRSCITSVGSVAGKQIITIEGLERRGNLHPVQEAFLEAEAMQCGYCIPGMIISGTALLNRKPNPTDKEIRTAMQGNICRCGTYARIVTAIRSAAKKKAGQPR